MDGAEQDEAALWALYIVVHSSCSPEIASCIALAYLFEQLAHAGGVEVKASLKDA